MRVAIIVGHTDKSRGSSSYNGISEYDFNTIVASHISSKLENIEHKVFFRDKIGLRGVAKQISKWAENEEVLSLELHFNSFAGNARGCECLVHVESPDLGKTISLADKFTDEIAEVYKIRQRHPTPTHEGVKIINKKERGASNLKYMINAGVTHSLLIEPCFANKETVESTQIIEDPEKYAGVLSDVIYEILKEDKLKLCERLLSFVKRFL